MPAENGRELFKPWIAERGQAYFECGHVVEQEEEGFVVRLKQITAPDHWSMIFEKLLKKASNPSERMCLYHFEGLCTELTQCPFLTHFKNYEENLRKWDPKRTLMLYAKKIIIVAGIIVLVASIIVLHAS